MRLHVTAAAEGYLRHGHPWLFADSIRQQNRPGHAGDLAVVFDGRDRFLAVGLLDPASPIRVRVLHRGRPCTIDDAWFAERLDAALNRRNRLFDPETTGYRCINGESDGWPGLVLDRYDTTFVLKIYTAAWFTRIPMLVSLLQQRLRPERLVLRLSRNIQSAAARVPLRDGLVLHGSEPPGPVIFSEHGVRFAADVIRGQKTGFFLDQRENRRTVESLAEGRAVLNAFSFSGGFSVYAARGGARCVTDLDISEHALAASRRNFALNTSVPSVAACEHRLVQADAFEWFQEERLSHFDLIVLDPPSLAKRESERPRALAAYSRLAMAAMERLAPGGILVAASCSAHVSAEEFFETVRQSARSTRRAFSELRTTRHAPDHPATFPEAEYLKCIYLEFTR